MNKATFNSLLLSLAILSLGTLNGWLQIGKLTGPESAASFLFLGVPIALTIFLFQALVFRGAQKKLLFQLIYFASFGFTLGWFLISFVFPMLWGRGVGIRSKIVFFTLLTIIFIANILLPFRTLERKWKDAGAAEFNKLFKPANSTVDWGKVVKKMKIQVNFYFPGVPESWTPAITILMMVSFFLGLVLVPGYPTVSVFAAGLPFSITVAWLLQMSCYGFAQAYKVRTLEKSGNMTLESSA